MNAKRDKAKLPMPSATAGLCFRTHWAGMDGYIKRKILLMKINTSVFEDYFIHIFRWGQKNV